MSNGLSGPERKEPGQSIIWEEANQAAVVVLESGAARTIGKVLQRLAEGRTSGRDEAGVLLGSRGARNNREAVFIRKFLLLHETGLLKAVLESHGERNNPREYAVGYCRVRRGESVEQGAEETTTFETHFPGDSAVMLVAAAPAGRQCVRLYARVNGVLSAHGTPAALPAEAEDMEPPAPLVMPLRPVPSDSALAGHPAPAAILPSFAEPEDTGRRRFILYGILAGLILGGIFVLALLNGLPMSEASAPGGVAPDAPVRLRLSVQREGEDFRIRWDPDIAGVAGISRGVITITDGAAAKPLVLDLDQLRSGNALYRAASDDLDIRMVAEGASGRRWSEAVRVAGSGVPRKDSRPAAAPVRPRTPAAPVKPPAAGPAETSSAELLPTPAPAPRQ